MTRIVLAGLALMAACAEAPQTYRDLDRLSAEYARDASNSPQNAEEATAQDTCGMRRFAHLIGAAADQIDRAALPAQTRIITPDMMVTMDFSAQRLNIMVGTDGKVGSLRCF
jgi:hypothetical protein